MPPGSPNWTGYALVSRQWLNALSPHCDEQMPPDCLLGEKPSVPIETVLVPSSLDARHHATLLAANQAVIDKRFPGLLLKNDEVEEKLWIARNVVIHPTARIHPPVVIGEDSRIEAQTEVGPGTVIASGCVVDRKASVRNSVVLARSYIGETLEVNDSIVDRNRLVNTRINASLAISENFMLGSLSKQLQPSFWRRAPSRIAGVFLLISFSPLLPVALLYAWLKYGTPPIRFAHVLKLPAVDNPREWQTTRVFLFGKSPPRHATQPLLNDLSLASFLLVFIPGLISVVFGNMRLVGLPARTPENVKALPNEWRKLYLRGKPGLITQNLIYHNASPHDDDSYAADTFYSATASFRHDARLIVTYFKKLLLVLTGLCADTPPRTSATFPESDKS